MEFIFDSFFNGAVWDRSQIPLIAVLLLVLLMLLLLVVVVVVMGWFIQERIQIKNRIKVPCRFHEHMINKQCSWYMVFLLLWLDFVCCFLVVLVRFCLLFFFFAFFLLFWLDFVCCFFLSFCFSCCFSVLFLYLCFCFSVCVCVCVCVCANEDNRY